MTAEIGGMLLFLGGLMAVAVGVGLWLGVGAGLVVAGILIAVVGYLVGFDAYQERMKKSEDKHG